MDYWVNILALVGLYAILALSLNVICGLTGLLQLGHVGFFAVGAYSAGLLAIYGTVPALGPFNLAPGCLAAMIAAATVALVIGLPCLRLRGDYLAIATLGFGEITRMVLNNVEFPGCALTGGRPFGGATGISLPNPVQYAIDYSAAYATWPVILAACGLTYLLLLNLKRSYVGRAWMCIREDEIAARSMGVHVPRYKMLAFVISAVFAGLAGALFAHNPYSGLTIVPNEFNLLRMVDVLLIVVLGGLGSVTGALLASAVLVLLPEALRFLPGLVQSLQEQFAFLSGIDPRKVAWLSEHRQLLYAALLIALIRLMPNGLLGLNESPRWLRRLLRGRAKP